VLPEMRINTKGVDSIREEYSATDFKESLIQIQVSQFFTRKEEEKNQMKSSHKEIDNIP
jgi:hypothetical protein